MRTPEQVKVLHDESFDLDVKIQESEAVIFVLLSKVEQSYLIHSARKCSCLYVSSNFFSCTGEFPFNVSVNCKLANFQEVIKLIRMHYLSSGQVLE